MLSFRILAFSAACIGMGCQTSAFATLLAYEGFDYTPGELLAGKNGGVGFGVNVWVKIDFLPGNDRVTVYQNPAGSTAPSNPTVSVTNTDVNFDWLSVGCIRRRRASIC